MKTMRKRWKESTEDTRNEVLRLHRAKGGVESSTRGTDLMMIGHWKPRPRLRHVVGLACVCSRVPAYDEGEDD